MSLTLDHLGTITGSLNEGGWRAEGNIYNDADRLQWYQEAESWYWLYRGGAWEATPRLGFRGHLLPEDWEKTVQSSVAPWRGFTAQEILKHGRIQGIFFAEASSPANQHQLTVGESLASGVIKHILGQAGEYGHWNGVYEENGTVIWPEGITRLNVETTNSVAPGVWDMKEGNFWARLQEVATADTHLLYVSKDNIINYIQHPMFGATLPSAVMDITSSHLLEPLRITPRNTEAVGKVRVFGNTPGGLQISGSYPTDATAGPVITQSGVLATSATKLTGIATRKYLYANRSHTVIATLPGAMGLLFDIMDRVTITYSSAADGISWSAKAFWVEEIKVTLQDFFNGVSVLRLEAENTA